MLLLNWLLRPRRPARRPARPSQPRRLSLTIEELETRLAPANFFWTGAVNGNWNNPANWQGGVVPVKDGTATLIFNTSNLTGAQVKSTVDNLPSGAILGLEFGGGGGFTIDNFFDLKDTGTITDNSTGTNTLNRSFFTTIGGGSLTITAAAGAHLRLNHTSTSNVSIISSQLGTPINLAGGGQIDIQGIQFRNQSFLVSSVANGVITGVLTNQFQDDPAGGSVVVVNSGKLTLAAANNMRGDVTVNGGTLAVNNSNAFFASTSPNKTVFVNNGATLELNNGVSVPFETQVRFTAGGTLRNGDGSDVELVRGLQSGTTSPDLLTIAGPSGGKLTIGNPINLFVSPTTAPLSVAGSNFTVVMRKASGVDVANGIGDVTVGTGTTLNLNFGGTPAVAIPKNLIIGGAVNFVAGSNSNQIAATSNVTLNGVLNLNGFSNTIASLSGSGQANLGTGTLTINNTAANTFDGTFTGTGNLNKTGAGTLTLTGNSAAFAGVNKVMAGAEAVNGTLGGSVIVSGGATFGGVGTVGTIKTSSTQEKIEAGPLGTGSTGILRSGATTLDNKATFAVVLNASAATAQPQPGTDYDQLLSSGAVSLAGATLNVQLGGSFGAGAGRLYTIIQAPSITGTFAGLANGAIFTVSGTRFQITYSTDTVVLKELGTPTTTTLNISYSTQPANAVFGQLVTFTVNVHATQGGAPATSGSVTVASGTTVFGTAQVSNGQASFNALEIPVGTYNAVVAHYSGGGAFEASDSSPTQTLVVDKASTFIDLSPGSSTITFGEKGSVLAGIFVVSPGSGAATGTVRFRFSGGAGPVPDQDVTASPAATARPDLSSLKPSPNPYFITAQYLGDSNFNASAVSSAVTVTVNPAVTSGVIESISPDPSAVGTPVTYTMILTVPPNATTILGNPTGTVEFFRDGATSIGSVMSPFTPVAGSTTQFRITLSGITLPVGTYTITAQYTSDSTFYANSTTPGVTQTVTANTGPPVAITTFSTPIVHGQVPQTYTATVTVPLVSSPAPTGLMTFDADGVTVLGSSGVYTQVGSTNQYTVSISSSVVLPAGSHSIVAHFAGDGNYASSVSPAVTQVVNKADTTTSLAPPTSTIIMGNPGSLVATVAVTAPGSGTPTGKVRFVINNLTDPPVEQFVPLSGNTASPDLSSLTPGTYLVSAQYQGDENFNASSPPSAWVTVIVEQANVTVSIVAIVPNPQEYNTFPVRYFIRLTAPSTGPVPTGTVTITATPLFPPFPTIVGSADLSTFESSGGGVYTGTIESNGPALAPNFYIIRAAYSGDGNYQPQNGFSSQIVRKTTGPTVTISAPSVLSTAAGPVSYTVTYTDPFLDTDSIQLKPADVTLNASANATGVVTVGTPVVVDSTTVTVVVTISDITGNGSLGISIGPNTAQDQFGNLAGPAGPSQIFQVTGAPKLTIGYVNPPSILRAGTTTVLNIRVANIGNQTDKDVFVIATLPRYSKFNRASSTPGWQQVGAGRFRLDLGTLRAGHARTVKFAIRMIDQAPIDARVKTTAAVFDYTSLDPRAIASLVFRIRPRGDRWPTF